MSLDGDFSVIVAAWDEADHLNPRGLPRAFAKCPALKVADSRRIDAATMGTIAVIHDLLSCPEPMNDGDSDGPLTLAALIGENRARQRDPRARTSLGI